MQSVAELVKVALEHAADLAPAHELLLEAVAMARRIDAATAGGNSWLLAETIYHALNSCSELGLSEQELALAHEAYDAQRRAAGDADSSGVAKSLSRIGHALSALLRHAEGLAYQQRALAMYRRLAGDTEPEPETLATCVTNIGQTLQHLGRHDEACAMLAEGVDMHRRACGDVDSVIVAASLSDLGDAHGDAGRPLEAVELLREAVAMLGRLKPTSRLFAQTLQSLGTALQKPTQRRLMARPCRISSILCAFGGACTARTTTKWQRRCSI